MAAALAAFAARAKVAHVEAGLRTGNKHAPFPEEINRRVTSVVADYHFAPTQQASEHLTKEGIPSEQVFLTGNTVVDALYWMRDRVAGRPLPEEIAPCAQRLILVTAHRRESFGEPFRQLCLALRDVAERFEDVELIYPVHLNPNVREPVNAILGKSPRVRLIEPQPPDRFVALLDRAYLVITDSGGIQEEAPALGKPVLVLREVTERPEAVAAGVVKLVGTDRDRIVREASTLLTDAGAYAAMARPTCVYGDGQAAQRIVEVITTGRMQTPAFRGAS
jgi:UDP-N-acetylglucosamine 2-epimerase